jgi:hypothetical protein
MQKNKGLVLPLIIIIIAVLAIGGGVYYSKKSKQQGNLQVLLTVYRTDMTTGKKTPVEGFEITKAQLNCPIIEFTEGSKVKGLDWYLKGDWCNKLALNTPLRTDNQGNLTLNFQVSPDPKKSDIGANQTLKSPSVMLWLSDEYSTTGGGEPIIRKQNLWQIVIDNADALPKRGEVPQNTKQDQVANWKTYTNTKYGFEFKYPKEWASWLVPGDTSEKNFSFGPSDKEIYVTGTIETLINQSTHQPITIAEYAGYNSIERQTPSKYGFSEITVGGKKVIVKSSSQIGTIVYIPLNTGETLIVSGPSQSSPLFEEMFASFKFTK